MTHDDDLDRLLTAWLDDPYTPPAPHYLGKVLERSRRTRQRPAWTSLERWLPMADRIPRAALAPPMRLALLVLIVVLVAALAAGVAVVGSQLLNPIRPIDKSHAPYPIPLGGAAVIVFDSGDPPGSRQTGDIYTVRADGTDMRQLTSGPDLESGAVFSPDGTRIAYRLTQNGRDSAAVMDAGGGNRKTLYTASQASQDCVGPGLAWSPDGTSLIVPVSAACDADHVFFIVPADGSSPATKLLATNLLGEWPAWSPDGHAIAFDGRDGTGPSGLYVADVGGSRPPGVGLSARLISSAAGLDPATVWMAPRWSPDGTTVAAAAGTDSGCASSQGTLDAFVVKADGSSQRAVASEAAKEYNPLWSPDGQKLAFERIVDPSEDLNGRPCTMATWVANADGTNAQRIAGLESDDGQPPFWSPDGTRLLGNTVRVVGGNEHYDLYVVTIDGSSPMVTIEDVDVAAWQPLAAPLPAAPSFPAVSPSP